MRYDTVALYIFIDDFCKIFEEWERHKLLPTERKRIRPTNLTLAEMLTIMILFHMSPCKNFKWYYEGFLRIKHGKDFPDLVDYDRFIALMPRLFLPLQIMLHFLKGDAQGIYFMDSTHLAMCHNKRIERNKTFKGLAARGKSAMGWFYGFKLHIVINHKGQIMAVKITSGNTDDRVPVEQLTKDLQGFMAVDKGYVSSELFKKLYEKGLKMIVGIKKGMKNILMNSAEKLLLRKRFIVETVFDILKSETNINHTRHRSPMNAAVNIISALVAYAFKTNKPKVKGVLIHS